MFFLCLFDEIIYKTWELVSFLSTFVYKGMCNSHHMSCLDTTLVKKNINTAESGLHLAKKSQTFAH